MARRRQRQAPVGVRIIGGKFRGRKLEYSGDLRTRPMKDRVREALFNLLGHGVEGKVAIDLFAGTGALALEALSRGATRAVFIEQHRPTAQTIQRNAATLGVEAIVDITSANTFLWAKRLPDLGTVPWVVFCSPPYEFYVGRKDDMLQLLNHLIQRPPRTVYLPWNPITGSIFVNCPPPTSGTFAPIHRQSWGFGKSRIFRKFLNSPKLRLIGTSDSRLIPPAKQPI